MRFRLLLLPVLLICSALRGHALSHQDTTVSERVVAFVESHVGGTVGRGECWDLAAEALNTSGALWDGLLDFGAPFDPAQQAIAPGDILQFEHVRLISEHDGATMRASFPQHTAIVVAVTAPGVLRIAHQNFGEEGRKVSHYDLVLSDVVAGRIQFYRPVGKR